jgi:serine/threonine protein kinase
MKHPSADQLAAFGLGKLLGPSADTVVAHLETCVDCRRAVASLSSDSFVGRIQVADAGSAPSVVPPELANHPDYRIVRELGRGGMGVVYLARNTIMDRDEVLKVAHRALLEKPGASDRFLQEIRSAAQLMHVNVVRAYSVLRLGDLLVFAMEYVPGDDLAKIVRKQGALPVAHACNYAGQVALGLQHANEKGMVHRDIKPSNLILSKDGKKPVVKILDFGLAKMTSEVGFARDLTGSNKMLGTPDYIAPEQILDAAKADIRADIYSLGCTLYYLLSGSPPFAGGSLYEVLHAHSTAMARPLNLVRPDVPAELAAVVAKMLAKEPRKRYQTPGEVAKDLQPFTKAGAAPASAETPVRPETRKGKSPRTTAKTQEPIAAPKMPRNKSADSDPFAFAPKTMLGKSLAKRVQDRRPLWYGLAIALTIGLVGLTVLVAGVLRVQTPEGTIVVEVTPGDADFRVDVDRVTVPTEKGEPIEIRRQPGSHKLEVNAKGFKIYSQDVAIELGGRKKMHVRLEPLDPVVRNDKANRDKIEPIEKTKIGNAEPKTPEPDPQADVSFFDGKTLTGWEGLAGYWTVRGGAIVGAPRNGVPAHTFLVSKASYRDFELRFKVRRAGGIGNSGVQFRSIVSDPNTFRMVGPQIEIDSADYRLVPGTLLDEPAAKKTSFPDRDRISAVWKDADYNAMSIRCVGKHVTTIVNGVVATDEDVDWLPAEGKIGWQLNGYRVPREVTFKDITFVNLEPDSAAAKLAVPALSAAWESLFNGKDLTGWTPTGKKEVWGAENGILYVADGGGGWLMTDREYKNFEIKLDYKTSKLTNSGVALRSPLPKDMPKGKTWDPAYAGMEIQLIDDVNWPGLKMWQHTGAVYNVVPAAKVNSRQIGEWNAVHITAKGSKIKVIHNGEILVDANLADFAKEYGASHPGIFREKGHLGLQSHSNRTEFRNIFVKSLD